MGYQSIEQEDVTKSRSQTTVEAGVITPKRGVWVDRRNCRDCLSSDKKQDGDI